MKKPISKILMGLMSVSLVLGFALTSCSDDVDDSNLYSFTGETAGSYLEKTPEFSNFYYLLTRTRLSQRSQSTIAQLLKTRGHFTVFAPTNEAVQVFLDSIFATKDYDITQTPDSMAEYITRNSIIDNGDREAYATTDFMVGALEQTNMDDRYIMIDYDNDSTGAARVIVNTYSHIIQSDIEVENGQVHCVDNVLRISRATLPNLIDEAPNLHIFSNLLKITGWSDSLDNVRDEYYELNHAIEGKDGVDGRATSPNPEHRYYGYTAFVETDSIFLAKWGIPMPEVESNGNVTNWSEILAAVKQKCHEAYPRATDDDNFTSMNNAVNQFVAYHLVPARMTWEKLIIHYLEMGYAYKNPYNLTINCHEYYETMGGHHRLMKLTEGRTTDGKRINRHVLYDYTDYSERLVTREGIQIQHANGTAINNSLNGFYYPIDDILVYDDDVPNVVLNERLRWDVSSLFSEIITNGLRRISDANHHPIPAGYIERLSFSDDSRCIYLPYYGGASQGNYQADEYNIRGKYDFVMRLPPVPLDGTYELRFCAPCNPSFGMAQFYFGNDRNNLSAIGLPVDLRVDMRGPQIEWRDETDDPDYNTETIKIMRYHGYMKPPYHDGISTNGSVVTESMRDSRTYSGRPRLRRIIWTGQAKASETYYVRIKSLLNNEEACFLLDYMEWVPKSVYNGGEPEDIW